MFRMKPGALATDLEEAGEVPGFRVGRTGDVPGFRLNTDDVVETPEGPRIQTEGEGLSPYQSPQSPEWLRKWLSHGTWGPYPQWIQDLSK